MACGPGGTGGCAAAPKSGSPGMAGGCGAASAGTGPPDASPVRPSPCSVRANSVSS